MRTFSEFPGREYFVNRADIGMVLGLTLLSPHVETDPRAGGLGLIPNNSPSV